jgi:osmotically inducible protein OsmC
MDKEGSGFTIKESKLQLEARIPEIDEQKFKDLAAEAKANCPVSKLLNAKITLDAKLVH